MGGLFVPPVYLLVMKIDTLNLSLKNILVYLQWYSEVYASIL